MADAGGTNNKSNGQNNVNAANSKGVGSGPIEYGGFLDTGKSERAMWLMKCPALVSRCLQDAPLEDGGRPIAKVVLSIDPLLPNDDNTSPQFTMELVDPGSKNIPKSYAMDMSKDFVPMTVFSESTNGKFTVEGKILNKFDMRPSDENFENYGKLCRERTNKYMTKTRQVQSLPDYRKLKGIPYDSNAWAVNFWEKRKVTAKSQDAKRTRKDRSEMEEIMFKLFERQPNWTLKQLIIETDQPEQFMKDMLKDLCVYNNKGVNQGSYELKPEYKRSTEETPLD